MAVGWWVVHGICDILAISPFFLSPGMLHLATDELCYGISLLHSSRTLAIDDPCVSLYIISAPLFGCGFCNRYTQYSCTC